MLKCSRSQMNALFAKIAENASLYLPTEQNGKTKYTKWVDGAEYSPALNTVRGPKDFFFPQSENLMEFKTAGKTIEIIDTRSEKEDFVVFGVRACDARSLDVLDRVFLADPVDTYYAGRREHGVLITVACTKPAETCFCRTFGIDPAAPGGDIEAYLTEEDLYLAPRTEKGKALLENVADSLAECGSEAVEAQQQTIRERMEKLPLATVSAEAFGSGKTDQYFDDPAWKTLSESCLGCGTCTFVCPTCQCYDIKDFKKGNGVIRFRCWDSCMYSDFTKMSAGQPRLTQKERFRQRFMHKLVYFPTNNDGMFSCVGCGRCISKCPISMNIVKVMKTLGKETKAE